MSGDGTGDLEIRISMPGEAGVTREQFMDAFNVALVVGGSITIPHLRRAVEKLDHIL